jgi:hypothetical protein
MTRAELLEAASSRLTEAALFLVAADEDHLAADAEELAERVEFDSDKTRPRSTPIHFKPN